MSSDGKNEKSDVRDVIIPWGYDAPGQEYCAAAKLLPTAARQTMKRTGRARGVRGTGMGMMISGRCFFIPGMQEPILHAKESLIFGFSYLRPR
jgi:hypothetical protein